MSKRYLVHCYDCNLEKFYKDSQAASYAAGNHARNKTEHRAEVYDNDTDSIAYRP